MKTVNMHEAKTTLSLLVAEAMSGEKIVIAKAGKPLVQLIPLHIDDKPRTPGRFQGQIEMGPDFDQTPEEILAAFEGTEP